MKHTFSASFRSRGARCAVAVLSLALVASCDRSADPGAVTRNAITFPGDADIAAALQANFQQDPDNAKARELVQLLGGDKGRLDYKVSKVIYRQGAFETLYDVSLKMGQPGADSLQKLYATMIPKDEAAKLPAQTLDAFEKWLADSAATLEKTNPPQATALRATLENLGKCYRTVAADQSVPLIDGLGALISPARDGWYADKLQSPQVQLRCLPL